MYGQTSVANLRSRQYELVSATINPKEAFRDIRNYLAGQFVGSTRDDALLDEVLKCLFCKLYVELDYQSSLTANAGDLARAEQVQAVFAQVRQDFPDIYPADAKILLAPEAIVEVLETCDFSLINSSSDPVGDAFEVFAGSEARGRAGQFFTPRSVTDLLTELVDPKEDETVIDPACGAGGFLASVIRHHLASGLKKGALIRASARLYGIDKDAYLATLARLHVSLLTGGTPQLICADSLALQDVSGCIKDKLPKDGFDVLLTNPPFGAKIVSASAKVLR